MIYLVTGTPGTGKTSVVLKWVLDNKFGLFKDEDGSPRPIYSVNIPKINKQLLPIVDVPPDDLKAAALSDNFPDGSVIIVDEASEIYPARALSAKLPPHVEKLNTLRHHGLTLILITQNPTMIDTFVRNLVGKHIHIDRKQIGSRIYEWNACQTSFNASTFAQAYSEVYKPDKRTFGLYESSTKHIKFKKSISWYWYALLILPFVLAAVVWYANSSINSLAGDAVSDTPSASAAAPAVVQPAPPAGGLNLPSARAASEPVGSRIEDYVPRVRGLPETKPIYDGVRKVVNMETVAGCVKSAGSCNCYTHQATRLAIDRQMCELYVKEGIFDRYGERFAGSVSG